MTSIVPYSTALPGSVLPKADVDGVDGYVASQSIGLKLAGAISLSQPWTWYGLVQWRYPLIEPNGNIYLMLCDGASDDIGIVIQTAAAAGGSNRVMGYSGGTVSSPDSSIACVSGSVPESTWVRIRVVANGESSLVQVEDTTESGTLDAVSFSGVPRVMYGSGAFCAHWQLINASVSDANHEMLWAHLGSIKDSLPDYTGITRISAFDGEYRAFGNVVLDTGTVPDTLVAVYRCATSHLEPDGVAKMQLSTDGGATWSAEATVVTPVVNDDARDPQIMVTSGGRWVMAWFEWNGSYDYGVGSNVTRTMYSDDQGSSWSSPVTVSPPESFDFIAVSGPPCELTSGNLILPTYGDVTASGKRNLAFYRSTDNGASWSEDSTIIENGDRDEPNLLLYAANKLVCYIRNSHSLRRAVADETATPLSWSATSAVDCSGLSSPHAALLADGTTVLCVRGNQEYYTNTGLQAFELWTSDDDGETWSGPQYPFPVERAFMYGTPIQLASGGVFAWWSQEFVGSGYYWKEITSDV